MKFTCAFCSRWIEYGEPLFFCPFCGRGYSGSQPVMPSVSHIVIDSDSRRAVQEKYWNQAKSTISLLFRDLIAAIPRFLPPEEDAEVIEEDYAEEIQKRKPLNTRRLMELGECTSIAQFRRKLEALMNRIVEEFDFRAKVLHKIGASEAESRNAEVSLRLKEALGEAVDIEDAQNEIDLYREEAFIHEFCDSMCGILGCSSSEALRPALAYAPENIDFAELDQLRNRLMKQLSENGGASLRITNAHRELVSVLLKAQPILVHVLEENSLFALSAMTSSFDKKWKPKEYADRLNALMQKDYDPFFGEPPEEFIETFSKAASAMITFIGGLPERADSELLCLSVDEIERRVCQKKHEMIEEHKVECLAKLAYRWKDCLIVLLDKAYQDQKDMLEISEKLQKMQEEL